MAERGEPKPPKPFYPSASMPEASASDVEALGNDIALLSVDHVRHAELLAALLKRIEALEERLEVFTVAKHLTRIPSLEAEVKKLRGPAAPVAMEGYAKGMREFKSDVCWRLVDVGYDDAWACIKERGHDDRAHEGGDD